MDQENQQSNKRLKLDDSSSEIQGLTEKDVGISQYVSDLPGFKGILKARYTDFLVNEINPDGEVLHLTDLGLLNKKERRLEKRLEEREAQTGEKEVIPEPEKISLPEPTDSQKEKLKKALGPDIIDDILKLTDNSIKSVTPETVFPDKDARGHLHQLIREAYNSQLESKTTPENKFIITLIKKNSNDRRSKLDKSNLGKVKSFVHFTLYKENKETAEVAHTISRFLRIPSRSITYSGTKDRRGVTVQRACASKVQIERLNGLNKTLRGIKLGGFEYQSSGLSLGNLAGNEFFITIRNVQPQNTEMIDKSLQSLKQNGFINYYGMQRFGTFSISTHEIGVPLLQGDWNKAVDMILADQPLALADSVAARKEWNESHDASKALSLMPNKCVAESCVLKALSKNPKGYADAISQIPRNLRIIYVHAYQSYVWNTVVSERFKKFGLKVVPGDLILQDTTEQSGLVQNEEDGLLEDVKKDDFIRARPVTEEEIQTKSIFDIVLPTPGFDVVYPDNELKDTYVSIMAKDGLDPFKMRRSVKDYSLSGSYRSIMAKPEAVEWWFRHYEIDDKQLVRTDLDLMNENLSFQDRILSDDKGDKLAVILKLQLGSAQYATMALREIMKIDTARRGEGFFT